MDAVSGGAKDKTGSGNSRPVFPFQAVASAADGFQADKILIKSRDCEEHGVSTRNRHTWTVQLGQDRLFVNCGSQDTAINRPLNRFAVLRAPTLQCTLLEVVSMLVGNERSENDDADQN